MAFVGLTSCPLGCQYYDTVYAFVGGDLLSLETILQEVKRYQCFLVTVTDGEPLAKPNCLPLMRLLCNEGFEVYL